MKADRQLSLNQQHAIGCLPETKDQLLELIYVRLENMNAAASSADGAAETIKDEIFPSQEELCSFIEQESPILGVKDNLIIRLLLDHYYETS